MNQHPSRTPIHRSNPAESQGKAVWRLSNLRFAYRADQPVLRDVTGSPKPGRITALLGPNGSGKTTLLRVMLGLHPPQAGHIELLGRPLSQWTPAQQARRIALIPQRSSVRFAFTVREVVAMGRHALPTNAGAVADAIGRADLDELAETPVVELSAGQQQRVLLARAIAQMDGQGAGLLADEPVSAMDPKHALRAMARLRELAKQGLAVVVVLHDVNLALRFADDAWLLQAGRLFAQGPASSVLAPDNLRQAYGIDWSRHTASGSATTTAGTWLEPASSWAEPHG